MGFPKFNKDPDAILDYGFNWVEWLEEGETIVSAVWIIPNGISLDSQAESTIETLAWLSGGTVGISYNITCHITTSAGREDDRTLTIKVIQR